MVARVVVRGLTEQYQKQVSIKSALVRSALRESLAS